MKKIALLILSLAFVFSCNENTKAPNSVLLNTSECKVKVFMDSMIYKDSSTYFYLIPESNYYKITSAYFDCGKKEIRNYDTLKKKICDCNKSLIIENDTVKIYLEPNVTGERKFEDLTLLIRDKFGNNSYIDTTFYYKVK